MADWIGGQGTKPGNIGWYLGATRLVGNLADAFRGPVAAAVSLSFDNALAELPGALANVQAVIEAMVSGGRLAASLFRPGQVTTGDRQY